MSKIGFIFDMDGVIVDSNPLHRIAWAEYNRRHGVETTEEMQQWMYGKRNDQIVRHFFGEGLTAEEIFAHGAAKEETYRRMLGPRTEQALVPGVRQFLERHEQIPTAVATNAEPANVNFVLDQAHLRRFFRVTVDGHQVANPKPDPEVYLRAAELLQIEPGSCVVFEDSYTGVQAGLAAGMRVVGVSTTHDNLAGVSLLIGDFNDPALELWLGNLIQ
jgi:beta-phosphoglucomutase family hydrolase